MLPWKRSNALRSPTWKNFAKMMLMTAKIMIFVGTIGNRVVCGQCLHIGNTDVCLHYQNGEGTYPEPEIFLSEVRGASYRVWIYPKSVAWSVKRQMGWLWVQNVHIRNESGPKPGKFAVYLPRSSNVLPNS
jgi:hypothetical protein